MTPRFMWTVAVIVGGTTGANMLRTGSDPVGWALWSMSTTAMIGCVAYYHRRDHQRHTAR